MVISVWLLVWVCRVMLMMCLKSFLLLVWCVVFSSIWKVMLVWLLFSLILLISSW